MPISERGRAAGAGLLALALAACAPGAGGTPSGSVDLRTSGGGVRVVAPAGFCVDPGSVSSGPDGAFVLMSDCAVLGAGGTLGGQPGTAISASFAPQRDGLSGLEDFLNSSRGLRSLSRSGRSDNVRIRASRAAPGQVFVLVEDNGPLPIAGVERLFWRGFVDLGDHLAVLTSVGFRQGPAGTESGYRKLTALAAQLKAANAP